MNLNFSHCIRSEVLVLHGSCCVHLSLLCLFVLAAMDCVKHCGLLCSDFCRIFCALLPACKLHWTQQVDLIVTNDYVKMTFIFGRNKALDKVIQEFSFFMA